MLRALAMAIALLALIDHRSAEAFPPYRSTDAATADPWTLEGRLGLIRFSQSGDERAYSTPLLRVNLGLPHDVELVSELEYVPKDGRLGDAALGGKWIPFVSAVSLGIEVLALLPVSSEGGAGVEASLLATYRTDRFRAHLNAAGFHDRRPEPIETGWKGGAIGELVLGRVRPGLEAFAKRVRDEDVQVLAGAGVIVKLGPLDVRVGAHVGLSEAAPDVVASFWVAGALPLAD